MFGKELRWDGMIIAVGLILGAFGAKADAVDIWPSTPYEDWPSSGEVCINGIVTITNANYVKTQGWTKMTVANGGKLIFDGVTEPMIFKADRYSYYDYDNKVSHVIQLMVTNCASFELRGTCSGYWSNTKMEFYDSNVIIGNENALIPRHNPDRPMGKDRAENHFYFNYGSAYGSLTFRNPEWDRASWTGKKAFTNHADIIYFVTHSQKYYQHYAQTIGSRSADEYVVQDGDVYWKGFAGGGNGQTYVYVRGNFEQIYGSFGRTLDNGQPTYIEKHPDYSETPMLKIAGTTEFRFGSKVSPLAVYQNFSKLCLANSGGYHAVLNVNGRLTFGAENVLDDLYETSCTNGVSFVSALSTAQSVPCMDLCGYDQRVARLISSWNYYPADRPDYYFEITSEKPATLTLYYPGGLSGYEYTIGVSAKFTGQASLVVNNGAVNNFCRVVSETSGNLTIKWGTARFKLNAGWSGNNLVVEQNGVLDLQAGSEITCASATFGGKMLENGTYTVGQLKGAPYNIGSMLTGDNQAKINVMGSGFTVILL